MLTLTYLLTVHKNPTQLKRLIDKLNTENCKFYIHVDLKSDLEDFLKVIKNDNVFFIKERVDCIWGDYSLIQATLNLMINALKEKNSSYIFLSGQDYPLHNNTYIHDFFKANNQTDFIDILSSIDFCTEKEYNKRFVQYKYNYSSRRGDYKTLNPGLSLRNYKYLIKGKLSLANFKDIIKRKEKIAPFEMYSGSNWWALTRDTTQQIISFYESNKSKLEDYFLTTFCSDEIFIQTIIKQLIVEGAKLDIKPSITYVNWKRKDYKNLPVTFNINDKSELDEASTNFLFARKFDLDYDKEILDYLDKK